MIKSFRDKAAEAVYGVSAGAGFALPTVSFDVAYQFRFGDDVSQVAVLNQVLALPSGEVDFEQHSVHASVVVSY